MHFFRRFARFVAVPMVALTIVWSAPLGIARAGMVSTEDFLDHSGVDGQRGKVANFLVREDVRTHLRLLGLDPAEAGARVAGLTEVEVRDIAKRIDDLPAGQDAFGAVLGAALLIFLVLLITDLLGLTHVFPFVRHR